MAGLPNAPDWPGAADRALFLNQRGGRLSVKGAHDIITAIAHDARLDHDTTTHVLRHTFATRLVRDGTDLVVVAELLGRDGAWTLELVDEAPSVLPTHSAAGRVADLDADGVDLGLVALSSVAGIEGLPDDEARAVLAAHDAGVDTLPERLRGWGSACEEHRYEKSR